MNINPIYKKLLIITGKILFLSFVIISMAFVNNEYKKKKVQVINIKIETPNPRMMCSTEDIELYLNRQFELKNEPYQNIHFNALEKYLNEKNEIKQSAVYFTPDGQLYIRVIEKKPIARIISKKQHYYIDDEWKVFKVTTPYKVPLILGKIYENPEIFRQYPIYKIFKSEALSQVSVFDDIYKITKTIYSDTLINNLIDYIYINENKEITIYPIVGTFKIHVGTSEYFEEKMNKLKLFIINGLNKNNAWNKYSDINIKYKNLIYCTKK